MHLESDNVEVMTIIMQMKLSNKFLNQLFLDIKVG